ncbi:MAG: hypothetical protein LBJ64_07720 [Deltaproteobacteria bacterium]|jgi:hypothetical protein|nr:hypothetical protein [Deltaproteobacteria bacterium]
MTYSRLRFPALRLSLIILCLFFFAAPLRAKTLAETGAPPQLAAWAPWVLYGSEGDFCPKKSDPNLQICVFPLSLSVNLDQNGGSFAGVWEVRAESSVSLPGQLGAWPEDVVDSYAPISPFPQEIEDIRAAAAGSSSSLSEPSEGPLTVFGSTSPQVTLAPGRHRLSGRFAWKTPPQTLTLPMGPVLDIVVSGQKQGFPLIDENYSNGTVRLWLTDKPVGSSPSAEGDDGAPQTRNQLTASLDRLLLDFQPMAVVTRVRLTVSGASREELIPDVLLPGLIPTSFVSPLPARLTAEGIRVQLTPGIHDFYIEAIAEAEMDSLGPVGSLADQETWTFIQQPLLRQVEVSGAPQIDPSQVELPWGRSYRLGHFAAEDGSPLRLNLNNLPIYQLQTGDSLVFTTLRRGDPDPGPDLLQLQRTCWLDFDGRGLSCRDDLAARMSRQWFLAAETPFVLGQVSINGVPQVITWQTDSQGRKAQGVQLRLGQVNLTADLRLDDFQDSLPASGWDQSLQTTSQLLNLPPGYDLLWVSGARAYDSLGRQAAWADRWTYLDLFICLAVILAAFKLLGLPWAILGALAVVLSYHEFMAPRIVFLHIFGATALLSVMPKAGKARFLVRSWRFLACLFLSVCVVAFVIIQARVAMYPQLDRIWNSAGWGFPLGQNLALTPRSPNAVMSYDSRPQASPVRRHYDAARDDYEYEYMEQAPAQDSYDLDAMGDSEDLGFTSARRSGTSLMKEAPAAAPALIAQNARRSELNSSSLKQEGMAQNSLARPNWSWHGIALDYNGQVAKDQTTDFVFLKPTAFRLVSALRILLTLLFSLAVIVNQTGRSLRDSLKSFWRQKPVSFDDAPQSPDDQAQKDGQPSGPDGDARQGEKARNEKRALPTTLRPKTVSAILLLLAAAALFFASPAFSQNQEGYQSYPSEAMLQELKTRLLRQEPETPPVFPEMVISVERAGSLTLSLSVEASQESIIFLPELDQTVFQPTAVSAQGEPLPLAIAPGGLGRLALVPKGRSVLTLRGNLKKVPNFLIAFKHLSAPMRVSLKDLPGWSIAGLDETGRPLNQSVYVYTEESLNAPAAEILDETQVENQAESQAENQAEIQAEPAFPANEAVVEAGASPDDSESALSAEATFTGSNSAEPIAPTSAESIGSESIGSASIGSESIEGASSEGESLEGASIENEPLDSRSGQDAIRPFFMVSRVVSLGVYWKIYTTATPLYPLTTPYSLTLPLVKGEKPTSSDLTVRDDSAVLNFPAGLTSVSFESSLQIDLEKPIVLSALSGPYAEAWSLDAASFWRAETSGLAPIYNVSPNNGFYNPRWRPWPGETLTIAVSRPEPAPGDYMAIDQASLIMFLGEKNRSAELEFRLRTSYGGPYSFNLPPGSELQSVKLDGQSLPTGPAVSSSSDGPLVTLPLNPGEHDVALTFLENRAISSMTTTPEIKLSISAANIDYQIRMPNDRWTLVAGGPIVGPAVLFWSLAGAIAILSLCLGRFRFTPLTSISWFLLFLGLSQLSVVGAFVVAGWLLVLGLRGRKMPFKSVFLFNFSQILLFIWTGIVLYLIYKALQHGLLDPPYMRTTGNNSNDHVLRWFVDRANGLWPEAWVLSIPERIYRYIMLLWALWLALSVIRWLRWGWRCFSQGGYWRERPPKPPENPAGGPPNRPFPSGGPGAPMGNMPPFQPMNGPPMNMQPMPPMNMQPMPPMNGPPMNNMQPMPPMNGQPMTGPPWPPMNMPPMNEPPANGPLPTEPFAGGSGPNAPNLNEGRPSEPGQEDSPPTSPPAGKPE